MNRRDVYQGITAQKNLTRRDGEEHSFTIDSPDLSRSEVLQGDGQDRQDADAMA